MTSDFDPVSIAVASLLVLYVFDLATFARSYARSRYEVIQWPGAGWSFSLDCLSLGSWNVVRRWYAPGSVVYHEDFGQGVVDAVDVDRNLPEREPFVKLWFARHPGFWAPLSEIVATPEEFQVSRAFRKAG